MKRLLLFLLSLSVLMACDRLGQGARPVINLDSDQETEISLSEEANEFFVSFTSSMDWTCEIQYTDDSYGWANVNKKSGTGGYTIAKVKVSVQKNDTASARSAKLVITSSSASVEISFSQKPSAGDMSNTDLVYRLSEGSADLTANAGRLSVVVEDNAEYQCSVDVDWMCMVDYVAGEYQTYVFDVSENTTAETRSTVISFCVNNNCIPFVVTQASANMEENPEQPDHTEDPEEPGNQEDQEQPEDDSWKTVEFKHRSLAMRFTADWCGFCPLMAIAMNDAQSQLQGNLEVLNVHSSDSGLASEASGKLMDFYMISSFPTGLIDCRTFIDNSSDTQATTARILDAVRDTEENYDVVTAASWISSISGSDVTLDLAAYIQAEGFYIVTALLVEDGISSPQTDYYGSGGNYIHDGIIRAALSDACGQKFECSEAKVKRFKYEAVLPSGCDMNNVRVLVYIQKLDSTNGSYYVDNAMSESLGKVKTLDIPSGVWNDGNEGIVPGDDISL